MKIVTYATHSDGTFEQIKDQVEVLGWGTKWNGFMDKFNGVKQYLDEQSDDEIVVFIDGFDSLILKSLTNLEEDFKSLDCKVLFSLDEKSGFSDFVPSFVEKYFRNKIFGTCKDGVNANSGLYMGYTKYLKMVLEETLRGDSDDDQRNLNRVCEKFPFLQIDTGKLIFENCSNENQIKQSKAYFCQIPCGMNMKRFFRAIQDYSIYFIPEILFCIALVIVFLNRKSLNFRKTKT
jgi:hypothetical protein